MNVMDSFSLKGKVALITGASYGIGFAIACAMSEAGATIVFNDIKQELVDKGLASYAEKGIKAHGYVCDVTDEQAVNAFIAQVEREVGVIDILVNNAGICVLEDFDAPDYAVRDRHIDINIKGVWNVTHAVLPHMIEKKDGRIVVMSSVTGYMVADPGEAAYAMTKAALIGFTRAMAREVADHNIRVNAICPGYVRTPLVEGMAKQSDPENPERAIQAIADAVPLKRLAHPEEVGELAAFLASDESSYITGTQIVIDGGSTLPETSSMGQ